MIRWQRRRHYTEVYVGPVRILWRLAWFGPPAVTYEAWGAPGWMIFTCGPLWIEWPEAGHGS